MSSMPVVSEKEDRRSYPRRNCEQFNYVDFGRFTGSLLDLSEFGLGFHCVEALAEGQVIQLKFVLPDTNADIEANAQVMWSNDSMKRSGLRFIDLSENARRAVSAWVAEENREASPSSIVKEEGSVVLRVCGGRRVRIARR